MPQNESIRILHLTLNRTAKLLLVNKLVSANAFEKRAL